MIDTTHRLVPAPPAPSNAASNTTTVVARWAEAVVVLTGTADAVATALHALAPPNEAEPSGAVIIERLSTVRLADTAAAVATPGGWQLFSTGRGTVVAGPTPFGDQPSHTVDAATPLIWVGIGEPPTDSISASLDLRSGIVAAPGAHLVSSIDDTSEVAAPADGEHFEVVDLGSEADQHPREPLPIADEPAPPPAPPEAQSSSPWGSDADPAGGIGAAGTSEEVLGIQCSRNHFNNPSAAYCQVCGISMVHLTHYLIPGIRPTLGFLVFDDGATFALDRSYRVGREPLIESGSSLAPLVLRDQRHSVSRSHAELLLDGWDVLVSDLGSTNGTFIWDAGQQTWGRVMPGDPKIIAPGTIVAIGRKTFVYETVARSV